MVIYRHSLGLKGCLIYAPKRTSVAPATMSASDQQATSSAPFDRLRRLVIDKPRIHVPLFAEARSIALNSVSLKRQPSASKLVLA